jgi:hypothetical protein
MEGRTLELLLLARFKNILFLLIWAPIVAFGQIAPNEIENIDFLVTFGKDSETSWGDDSFAQTFFFSIPDNQTQSFYIRIFDPDIGGTWDELNGAADTKTKFSFYGGKGAYSEPDARDYKIRGNYNSGSLLWSRIFDHTGQYDNKWYSLGPFSPLQGEYITAEKSYYFKMIAEGLSGNDGNLYKYAISLKPDENIDVQGANAFTFRYTFRLPSDPSRVSHLYPFISSDVVAINIHNFDFDHGGSIFLYSVSKNRHVIKTSGDNEWIASHHKIDPDESNSTIDIQMVNNGMRNNNVVIYITNEYNTPLPFYTIPIGGPPKYKYKATITYTEE